MPRRLLNTVARPRAVGAVAALGGLLSAGAVTGEPAPAAAPRWLAETGLYARGSVTEIAPGNLPFSPQYPLWSDGAGKRRFIRLPAGTAIDASRPDAWSFPRGTRFWKEFSAGGLPVETRTIERLPDGTWRYATYVWNQEGTAAELAPARGIPAGIELRSGARYVIPGEADCRACHEGRETPILGFSALQLSPDRDPGAPHAEPPPAGAVDLRALASRGLATGLPRRMLDQPPRIQAATPTARAALGYLHANCGACHNAGGPLAGLGLSLAQELGPRDGIAAVLDSVVQPSLFRPASFPDAQAFRVVPGHPDRSALVARMRARDPVAQMPPLGTQQVDRAGLALIERWIRESTPNLEHANATK